MVLLDPNEGDANQSNGSFSQFLGNLAVQIPIANDPFFSEPN
jgi:hypothetical protein